MRWPVLCIISSVYEHNSIAKNALLDDGTAELLVMFSLFCLSENMLFAQQSDFKSVANWKVL